MYDTNLDRSSSDLLNYLLSLGSVKPETMAMCFNQNFNSSLPQYIKILEYFRDINYLELKLFNSEVKAINITYLGTTHFQKLEESKKENIKNSKKKFISQISISVISALVSATVSLSINIIYKII